MVYLVYLHCEIHHKSPYNVRFGPGKVLEKSLVLVHQNLWEPWLVHVMDWCHQATSHYLEGWAQDCSNFIANALEILQSCTKPSIWSVVGQYLCHHMMSLGHNELIIIDCYTQHSMSAQTWARHWLTNTLWHCHMTFSQWQHSFQMKVVLPLAEGCVTVSHCSSAPDSCVTSH